MAQTSLKQYNKRGKNMAKRKPGRPKGSKNKKKKISGYKKSRELSATRIFKVQNQKTRFNLVESGGKTAVNKAKKQFKNANTKVRTVKNKKGYALYIKKG